MPYFNSIKVQLEQPLRLLVLLFLPHFNSIKVQLELPIFPLPLSFPSLFQFHKGTIRTY